jgi:molecular chaperone GrpE
MGTTETTDVAPNTVVSEVLRGWMLHERLVRPALVSVARAPTVADTAASPASGNGVPAADEGVS